MTEQEAVVNIFERLGVEYFTTEKKGHVIIDAEGESFRDKDNYLDVDQLSFVFDENGEAVGFDLEGKKYSSFGITEFELNQMK